MLKKVNSRPTETNIINFMIPTDVTKFKNQNEKTKFKKT